MWKIAAKIGAIGLLVCAAPAISNAARGGGGYPGGGGGGHPGGSGGPHFAAPGGGRPGGGGHPGGGGPHFAAHVGGHRGRGPHFAAHVGGHPGGGGPHFAAHVRGHRGRGPLVFHTPAHLATPQFRHLDTAGGHIAQGSHGHLAGDPKAFAAHRQFVAGSAFSAFWTAGWHPYHHLGWIGPLFWPYAYGDFFYYALWPDAYAYADPFWVYGYGDIYEGIFAPYSYDQYVRGPHAQSRMTALTEQMVQSCADEAAEVTEWPIDRIHETVQPDPQQSALLDDLGNAVVKASEVIRSHCPVTVSFTPTGRLAEMQQRLQALTQAVDLVEPPLTRFYDALNDEQKARFNAIGSPQPEKPSGATAANPLAQCNASVMNWPGDQIDRVVRPTDAQRTKLEALHLTAEQAQDIIKATCPSEIPSTPPARLHIVGQRLQAMRQAAETIRPVLNDFYEALSDDQKARFNTMGRQLFAANRT